MTFQIEESETINGIKARRKNKLLRNIPLDYINTLITNLNMQSAPLLDRKSVV